MSPRRVTPRLSDLTHTEVTDLFLTVQRVGRMIERVYNGTSLNVAMQDGIDAGQSVPVKIGRLLYDSQQWITIATACPYTHHTSTQRGFR